MQRGAYEMKYIDIIKVFTLGGFRENPGLLQAWVKILILIQSAVAHGMLRLGWREY